MGETVFKLSIQLIVGNHCFRLWKTMWKVIAIKSRGKTIRNYYLDWYTRKNRYCEMRQKNFAQTAMLPDRPYHTCWEWKENLTSFRIAGKETNTIYGTCIVPPSAETTIFKNATPSCSDKWKPLRNMSLKPRSIGLADGQLINASRCRPTKTQFAKECLLYFSMSQPSWDGYESGR